MAACLAQSRAWRSSSPSAGWTRNGKRVRSGLAVSRARSRAAPAAAGSPSPSRAIASIREALISHIRRSGRAEPSRTGASASVAACGSPWASRSAAMAVRMFGGSCSPCSVGACSARSVSPRPTRASSPKGRPRAEWVQSGQVPGLPLGGLEVGQRVGVRLRASSSCPRMTWTPTASAGSASALTVCSARWTRGSASSGRPCETNTAVSTVPAAGWSVQPCRSASSTACLPRAAARAHDRSNSVAAWCARPVNSRKRPPDPAGQRYALLQVPLRLLEPGRPQFRRAEADQRQRAVPCPGRAAPPPGLDHRLQLPRLLGRGR
jgi:hypothetical protein